MLVTLSPTASETRDGWGGRLASLMDAVAVVENPRIRSANSHTRNLIAICWLSAHLGTSGLGLGVVKCNGT
jgi:hypothetical protein